MDQERFPFQSAWRSPLLIVGDLFLDVVGRIRRDELSVEFKALVEVTPGLLVVAVVDKSEECHDSTSSG